MPTVVFTGGARSGKSRAAQRYLQQLDDVTVVVFGSQERDDEMAERIAAHRHDRPKAWRVIEADDSTGWLHDVAGDRLLLDCAGTLLGRVMEAVLAEMDGGLLADAAELPHGYARRVEARFDAIIDALLEREADTVIVTNEVGDGVVPAYASGRVFRDVLGRANRRLVDDATSAYLVVTGRLIELTALPTAMNPYPGDQEVTR